MGRVEEMLSSFWTVDLSRTGIFCKNGHPPLGPVLGVWGPNASLLGPKATSRCFREAAEGRGANFV